MCLKQCPQKGADTTQCPEVLLDPVAGACPAAGSIIVVVESNVHSPANGVSCTLQTSHFNRVCAAELSWAALHCTCCVTHHLHQAVAGCVILDVLGVDSAAEWSQQADTHTHVCLCHELLGAHTAVVHLYCCAAHTHLVYKYAKAALQQLCTHECMLLRSREGSKGQDC